jgi:alpha-2-macroglobulin
MKPLRILFLLALAAPGLSQPEGEPYFSLNSFRTWGSNSKPSVSLNAWGIDALEFRVYRVNDPVRFFEQLESPHNFGGRVPRPAHEPTLLERIRDWKHSRRATIRRSIRAQFTNSPTKTLFGSPAPAAALPKAATAEEAQRFAAAPVLNSQQLVLRFVQPSHSQNRWQSQTVPVRVNDPGVYLVEAVHGEMRAYTIVMVSDLAMITKVAGTRIVSFVADRTSGEPVRGAELWMVTRDGKFKTRAETDADGIVEWNAPPDHPEDVRLVAHSGANFAANTLTYAFGDARDNWTGYIYTDRPVYRPGHTVHFRGIVRFRGAAGYEIPTGKPMQVEIQDQDQKPVYKKSLSVSAAGTIHDEVDLPPSAALGEYSILVHGPDDSTMSGNFAVEEYKKPEYEVRVTPPKLRILEGEKAEAVIDAHYYFGEPVAGAKVKYAVYRSPYYFPLWYNPDEAEDAPPEPDTGDNDFGNEQILEQDGTLDAEGKLTVRFDTTVSARKTDYRYRVEARVTDEARREITGSGGLIATYGTFRVNITPERYFYQPGARAGVTVEARDYELKSVQTRVHVELVQVNPRNGSESAALASADAQTSADGTARAELTLPPQGGSYRIRATARTPEGRDVQDDSWLWVSGGLASDFGADERKTIQMVADKRTYRPGDIAKVMIVTGRPNTPVYVTMEGRALRMHKVLHSADATAVFEIPVTVQDEPGIYVGAHLMRNGELYSASKYIRVPPEDHKLQIAIATDQPQYLPGGKAQYSIQVNDAAGKPVPRTELSLGVVDEAIYAIRRDFMQDPLLFFFGHDWNRVRTEESFNFYFQGEAGKRRMQLAQLRQPSRLAQLKPDHLVQPKVRKAFPDTAFWAADLTTDAAGRARAKVDFPDSLTTWRATARGVAPDTKVGAATQKTIVRKNLILRLAVPRFFMQGDEVTISALVHNYLPNAKTARVSLDMTGLDVVAGATKDVEVPSRGEVRVEWRVRAQQVRSATLTGKALTDEESDALELTLPVNIPGVKLGEARGGVVAGGQSASFDLTFPAKVQPGSRTLELRASPSIAGSLFSAVEYLTTFPYGCVEQIMSSFLPNVIVTRAVSELGVKADLERAEVQQKIRAGLDRLYSFQHEDGGWGWWETDESHPFMTAYVAAGLAQAKAAGVQVEQERIDRGGAWVRKALKEDAKLNPDLRTYMAYAVSDKEALSAAYDQRAKLSPYGLALLGLGLENAEDARAGEVAGSLESAVQQDAEQAWWPASRDPMLDFAADVTPEATAYAVKFLSHQKPQSPLLPKAALWLMNHRSQGWWWNSTKQTAMVIYGLTDYLKTTNELNPNLAVTVFVNDQPVLTKKLASADGIEAPALRLDESKLQPGMNRVRIATTGTGRLYYSARADYFTTEEKMERTGTIALNLLRDYFRLEPTRTGDRIVYDLVPLNGPVASGDVIAVRLTATGSEWKYVMLEDPIPAGTEFIQRDSSYELKSRPPWWEYSFTRRELHDDHMAIFQTWMPAGQHQYFYLLKVVNPGLFQVSPARIGPMYQPGVMATTESRRLEAK